MFHHVINLLHVVTYIQKIFSRIFCFFFQLLDSVDDDLPIFVLSNIVSIEEGFAFNKLSKIYVLLVRLLSFDYPGIGRGDTLLNVNTLLNDIKFSGLSGL